MNYKDLYQSANQLQQSKYMISQREGRQPHGECPKLLFGKSFAENCMKMKEIGLRVRVGGSRP